MKKFLYFIQEEDGRFLYVKNGTVQRTTDPIPLSHTPDGWQEITIAWERDMKLLGLIRQLSLPFGFVMEPAMILRQHFYSQSLEKKLFLLITRHEPAIDTAGGTFDHVYRKFYKGEIDPTSYKDSALKIEANLSEGGLHKLYAASKSTVFEYPLSEGDATVKLDGINLYQTGRFFVPFTDTQYRQNHFLDVAFVNKEGEGAGVAFFSEMGGQVPFNYNYNTGTNYFMSTAQAIPGIRIKGEVKMRPNHVDGSYTLYLWRTSVGAVNIATINNPVGVVTIPFDLTINAVAGEKFYLGANRVSFQSGIVSYFETNISVSIKSRYRTTYARAYTPLALYKRLCKSVFGSENVALSTLLSQYNHIKLTSGDGLRSIEGAKIKTSLDAFLEFCNVQMFSGFGIESGKAIIEEKNYFLNPSNPIALGPAKNHEVTEATDLLFNTVRVGYSPTQTDDVNGRFSFNNSFTFGTHITRVNKELTIVCPYTADPYAIELTRINLEGKTTTDDKSDNQVFMLDAPGMVYKKNIQTAGGGINSISFSGTIEDVNNFRAGDKITLENAGVANGTYTVTAATLFNGLVVVFILENIVSSTFIDAQITPSGAILYRNSLMAITGVPDPDTIFNIRFSPKRILLKWMPWINSILYREAGTPLTFLTTEKNADLKTVEAGVTTEEKANLTIGSTRLFLAKELSFENMTPSSLANTLEQTPNRAMSYEWDGVTYTGFIRKAGMAPNDEKEQTFKLLSAASNDFKNLIHV